MAVFVECNVSAATAPKPPPQDIFPGTVDGSNRTCLSGKQYTTKAGDTCHSIALAQSIAEKTLASINDLTVDCTRLTELSGTTLNLCLPQTCQTIQTGAADDCWTISSAHNISFAQFIAYNPSLNGDCTNLGPNGTVVCVSSPDGSYTPVSLPGSNSSWALGEYANSVVPAPGSTAFGTTSQCGAYYQVQIADTCNRISLAAKVSIALFQEINPSIDAACDNLIPNLWYCVHPTYDWNVTLSDGGSTPSSTTVAPPGPTPTGTTGQCYKWHLIVSGDNCALLQATLGVTMTQLVAWNPNLKADCSNLLLGEAYCVQGPPLPSSSTTTAATTIKSSTVSSSTKTTTVATTSTSTTARTTSTVSSSTKTTSAAPSSTSAASSCAQTYTVVSGDWCSKIWGQYSLTEAQFRALNPTLDANCDLSIGQVLCVAAPSTCKTTYTVVSGDWCSKIWAQYNLTEAQFRALNPSLNANCDLTVGQKLCVG